MAPQIFLMSFALVSHRLRISKRGYAPSWLVGFPEQVPLFMGLKGTQARENLLTEDKIGNFQNWYTLEKY